MLTEVDSMMTKQSLLPHEYLLLALNAPEREPAKKIFGPGGNQGPKAVDPSKAPKKEC